jgi:hypothetical protein
MRKLGAGDKLKIGKVSIKDGLLIYLNCQFNFRGLILSHATAYLGGAVKRGSEIQRVKALFPVHSRSKCTQTRARIAWAHTHTQTGTQAKRADRQTGRQNRQAGRTHRQLK